MKFKNEQARLEDPQEKLIPQILWEDYDYFARKISDKIISLMQAPLPQDLCSCCWGSPRERRCVWTALAVSHEGCAAETLLHFGKQLGLEVNELFRTGCAIGRLDFVKYLADKNPQQLISMIEEKSFLAFCWAAASGHLEVMHYLLKQVPGRSLEMMVTNDFGGFCFAARYGHLRVLHYFAKQLPTQVLTMIEAANFSAFRWAASHGHLKVLLYLAKQALAQLPAMIVAANFSAFYSAVSNGHSSVINYLLSFSEVLAYAEGHQHEYDLWTIPFITQKLSELHQAQHVFEASTPAGVFTVKGQEARLLFYVLRNLIRRNDPNLQDEILFLLTIPDVKNLAHQEVTIGQPNELLRLALSIGNSAAASTLLRLPRVRAAAEVNNYYRAEVQRGLDVQVLAADAESSMRALTIGEQARLGEVLERYEPKLKLLGCSKVMSRLRNMLITRYHESPATIARDDDNRQLVLPLLWKIFTRLELSPSERKRALKAYYGHRVHSAWRYLSKPNYWMHEDASYVYVNSENPDEKWSTYEEYVPLISLLYLAASDEKIPAIDGHTLRTRIEQFIAELAYIGRAHNWDGTRECVTASGKLGREEYDDLEGDRPSCYSGVKRHLFQAVQGHPLLKVLTKDVLAAEVRSFVIGHFQEVLVSYSKAEFNRIQAAFTAVIDAEEFIEWELLQALNLSEEKREDFIEGLANKYGSQFTEFKVQVATRFMSMKKPSADIVHFGEYVYDAKLLERVESSAPPSLFFSPAATSSTAPLSDPETSTSVSPETEPSHVASSALLQ